MKTTHGTLALLILLGAASANAQHPTMPPGMSHEEHLRQLQKDAQLKHRGGLAMGFDQDKKVNPVRADSHVPSASSATTQNISQTSTEVASR